MLRWLAAVFCIAICNCTTVSPQPRTGGAFGDGSAKWALKIAEPLITAFAADVNLYEVFGADVGLDGRLPSNTGDWSFVAWSPTKQTSFQVTVKFDGSTSTTTRNEPSPPSFNGQAVPAGWVDSVDAFAIVAPYLACAATRAQVAVLNVASYAEAPNQSAWAINFDAGQNQLVKWDGTYIGPQGPPNPRCPVNLGSAFLKSDSCANIVYRGIPYNMKDPNWLTATYDQNRETCAYKFFSALHMLGYQTEMAYNYGLNDSHLRALHKFQADQAIPVGDLVTIDTVRKLDDTLKLRDPVFTIGQSFPLYQHMQPLHPHQISKDALATIYQLPMSLLPASLQMATLYENVQCINSQCVGSIMDANDNPWPTWPIDLTQDYRFVGAYFDPKKPDPRLPSAVVDMETVLHEYAHYLDGGWGSGPSTPDPQRPRAGAIDTGGFNDISYDKSTGVNACYARRTNDPKDWISRYGFLSAYACPAGKFVTWEEWAEAFQMYVTSGKQFRAAAAQNAKIAQKYNWLKTNAFQGREYDTDWAQALPSGCNDVPGAQNQQPGYMQCNDNYLWDGQLRIK
jgi:hypothetical protein